jgi:hypothetical protein
VRGENQEAGPEQDISRRRAFQKEVTLEESDEDDEVFLRKMFERSPDYQATLKNGATVDIAFGLEAWDRLNRLLSTNPDLIAAAQAKLRGEEISPSMRQELREVFLTDPDGALLPYIRDIFISAYQETKDGPVFTNPFKLDTEADRQAFKATDKLEKRNKLRFLRHLGLLPGNSGDAPPTSER